MRLIPLLTQAAVAAALLAGCSYVAEPPEGYETADVRPGLPASALDRSAASGPMEASVEDTSVYLEFPEYGPAADELKRLDFTVRVRNTGDQPMSVRVEDLFLSLDRNQVGRRLGDLNVTAAEQAGRMLEGNRFAVPAGGSTLVRIQGDHYFQDEEAGPSVYLTLVLRSGENTVAVREEAPVLNAR